MANLDKIFTGMDKGPETIDKNFNALNSDTEKALQGANWTDWTHNGVVVQNGFNEESGGGQINWRKLIDMNGVVLMTQIHGSITKKAYNGEGTAFAQVGGVPQPSRNISSACFSNNAGNLTGVAFVDLGYQNGNLILYIGGHPFGQYLDGWTEFSILY